MLVKTERVAFDAERRAVRDPRNLESPPAATAFARQLTSRFSVFAAEQLRRMLEMAKLVKISRWILDQQIPVDQTRIDSHPVVRRPTPRTVPTTVASRTIDVGWKRYSAYLMGGVSLTKKNDYLNNLNSGSLLVEPGARASSPAPGFKLRPIRMNGYSYIAASVSSLLGLDQG